MAGPAWQFYMHGGGWTSDKSDWRWLAVQRRVLRSVMQRRSTTACAQACLPAQILM
jgi:hypothetical protein